jgi:hypothetical protein
VRARRCDAQTGGKKRRNQKQNLAVCTRSTTMYSVSDGERLKAWCMDELENEEIAETNRRC